MDAATASAIRSASGRQAKIESSLLRTIDAGRAAGSRFTCRPKVEDGGPTYTISEWRINNWPTFICTQAVAELRRREKR
jgi:hypothetical protein